MEVGVLGIVQHHFLPIMLLLLLPLLLLPLLLLLPPPVQQHLPALLLLLPLHLQKILLILLTRPRLHPHRDRQCISPAPVPCIMIASLPYTMAAVFESL